MKKLSLIAALLVVACSRSDAPPQQQQTISQAPLPPNLLELTRGAAVVSRTGEATLNTSAVHAIDGDPGTAWVNPPENLHQSLTFSLPAPSRIEQLGIITNPRRGANITSARFELSSDGEHFTDAGTFTFPAKEEPQINHIQPANASYVRVTTLAGASPAFLQLNDVYAFGSLLAPTAARSLDGCWMIDGMHASFTQQGAYVRGRVDAPLRISVEGGFDGRMFRFAWTREGRPEYGLAAISVTPDNNHLSGIVWHEEAIEAAPFIAEDWLGDRVTCSGGGQAPAPVQKTYFDRFAYFPLYGLRFNDEGHLDEAQSAAVLDQMGRHDEALEGEELLAQLLPHRHLVVARLVEEERFARQPDRAAGFL